MENQMYPFGIELDFSDLISYSNQKQVLVNLIRKHSLVVIRAKKVLSADELLFLLVDDPKNELLHWDFGPIMEMRPEKDAKNYLFSREEVPLHWDGAFHKEPKFLLFNCVLAPDNLSQGETIFCNTEIILRDVSPKKIEEWKNITLCYKTKKIAHYGGEISIGMIQTHPQKNTPILRYAEPVNSELNPVHLSVKGAGNTQILVEEMKNLLYDPKYSYAHQWQVGDIVIADNFSLLHGRRAFTNDCERHFRRVQVL